MGRKLFVKSETGGHWDILRGFGPFQSEGSISVIGGANMRNIYV